ncbi:hypothetical protein ACFQMM_17505 [Saliphagus sp. GCM10025308]
MDETLATERTLHLASWEDRFWAWLIDVLLVGAALSGLGEAVGTLSLVTDDLSFSPSFLGTAASGSGSTGLPSRGTTVSQPASS